MIPGKHNFTIFRGGTWSFTLTAKDDNGSSRDFSKYDQIVMQIRPAWTQNATDVSPLLELSLVNGRVTTTEVSVTDEETSEVTTYIYELTFTVSATDTALIKFNSGKYCIDLIDSTEDPTVIDKILYGEIFVQGDLIQ